MMETKGCGDELLAGGTGGISAVPLGFCLCGWKCGQTVHAHIKESSEREHGVVVFSTEIVIDQSTQKKMGRLFFTADDYSFFGELETECRI